MCTPNGRKNKVTRVTTTGICICSTTGTVATAPRSIRMGSALLVLSQRPVSRYYKRMWGGHLMTYTCTARSNNHDLCCTSIRGYNSSIMWPKTYRASCRQSLALWIFEKNTRKKPSRPTFDRMLYYCTLHGYDRKAHFRYPSRLWFKDIIIWVFLRRD